VNDLAKRLQVSPTRVSHHLGILRTARLVRATREGQHVRYALTTALTLHPHTKHVGVGVHRRSTRSGFLSIDLPCLQAIRIAVKRSCAC
jgi:DNA-binding transcriptional ArsR family regulator